MEQKSSPPLDDSVSKEKFLYGMRKVLESAPADFASRSRDVGRDFEAGLPAPTTAIPK